MSSLSDKPQPRPPAFWRGLLSLVATEEDRVYLLDDLDEGFRSLADGKGLSSARGWYSRQAYLSLLPLLRRRGREVATRLPELLRTLGTFTMTDFIHSLRLLRKNLGTTAVAVLSLVIGITLNATIFSVVDWVWLSSSPFSEPDHIVRVFASDRRGNLDEFTYADYEAIRDQSTTMEGLAGAEFRGGMLTGADGTTRLMLVEVTSRNYFDVLGLQPSAGTVYHAGDDPGTISEPGVVISHALWEREFGRDPAVVGEPIQLTGRSYVILGVAPVGYAGLRRMAQADIWFPVETWWGPSAEQARQGGVFNLLGRVAPDTDLDRVRAEVGTLMVRLDIRDRETQTLMEPVVMTDGGYQTRNYGGAGALLLSLVAVVLIIACANVAGLQLARTLARQREMAIRTALGGRRARLIRQLLMEGIVVAGIAVLISLGLSKVILTALPSLLPPQPVLMKWGFGLDARVVGFTVVAALISAVLFSLPPALRASRPDMVGVLKGNDLSGGSSSRPVRGLNILVVAQLALSLVVVSTTALLLRSFLNTQSADLGIERNNVLVSWIWPRMEQDRLPAFYAELVSEVEALPGVRRAAMARTIPFFPSGMGATLPVQVSDAPRSMLPEGAGVKFNLVGPGYFDMMGIDVLRGRAITEEDRADGQKVVVVNETLANRVWPGEDPVGRTLRFGSPESDPVRVVGVAEDGKYGHVDETQESYLYLPFSQRRWEEVMLLAQTDGDPSALAGQVRDVIRSLGPDTFILPQTTLDTVLRDATYNWKLMALALGVFSLLGLVLAVVGLYGVSSYAVYRRRGEIGLRMALGAHRGRVLTLVMRQGSHLIFLGAGFGIPAAVGVGLLLRGNLFGVSPVDPLSLVGATLVLSLATFAAILLPSRRAASVDPMKVMRQE